MSFVIPALVALHALSGVFWAGSTGAMANLGAPNAERLFPAQMGAAGLTVLTGLGLWGLVRGASLAMSDQILLFGIAAAIIAGAVQGRIVGRARRALVRAGAADTGRLRARMATAHRAAAGLLAITVICMVIARFF